MKEETGSDTHLMRHFKQCPRCLGEGKVDDKDCPLCEGIGGLDSIIVGDTEITVKDKAQFVG